MTIRFVVIAVAFGAAALEAQIPASHIAEAKQRYAYVRDNIHKAAEAMPEENYSFKPTPDIRSFGELMAHIADAQAAICGGATGKMKPVGAGKKTTKTDIVAALRESSAGCDAGFESMTEASSGEPVTMGSMKGSRLGMLEYNTGHDAEEYGYAAVYLRLKGVVPPTSAGRGGPGR